MVREPPCFFTQINDEKFDESKYQIRNKKNYSKVYLKLVFKVAEYTAYLKQMSERLHRGDR